jgi:hypothetical protein
LPWLISFTTGSVFYASVPPSGIAVLSSSTTIHRILQNYFNTMTGFRICYAFILNRIPLGKYSINMCNFNALKKEISQALNIRYF